MGDLNWDYRYCWLRDASFTIRALLELDYWDEAEDFLDWLLHATRLTQPRLRILYSLYGDKAPVERELEYLTGYCGSRPVRIGNAAQRSTPTRRLWGSHRRGGAVRIPWRTSRPGNARRIDRLRRLCGQELGPARRRHLGAKVWTSEPYPFPTLMLDGDGSSGPSLLSAACCGERRSRSYKQISNSIRRQIEERAWNEQMQSYVSVLDSDQLDSSLLLLSWYGFEEAGSQECAGLTARSGNI